MKNKNKFLILFLCIFSVAEYSFAGTGNDSSRTEFNTPFNKEAYSGNWAIKGKVLPFVLGNDGGLNGLLGFEFGIFKRHSLGIDGYFLREGGSHDMVTDTAGNYFEVGNYHRTVDLAVFINYRYYFDLFHLRENKKTAPYAGAFVRYGHINYINDLAFLRDQDESEWEDHRSAGIFLGLISSIRRQIGIDVYIGGFYKQKVIEYVYKQNGALLHKVENSDNFGFRIGLNISFWFNYRRPLNY